MFFKGVWRDPVKHLLKSSIYYKTVLRDNCFALMANILYNITSLLTLRQAQGQSRANEVRRGIDRDYYRSSNLGCGSNWLQTGPPVFKK